MHLINEQNLGSELLITINVPWSNCCHDEFKIYCDDESEYIDLLCDYAQEHDENLDREKMRCLSLSDKEIEEHEIDGCLDDFICGGNYGTYLNFVIMRDYVSIEQNNIKLIDQVSFPQWAICGLVNGDYSNLNDIEIEQIEVFQKEQIELASQYSNDTIVPTYHFIASDLNSPDFCNSPEFGLACDCVDLYIVTVKQKEAV